ncbi:DUF5342 family protein [Salibacterium salarium]|uniref:DUF5342 family protein n=1 Tax=Salibacterium salarium TaxID=284579 RepID=UPI0036289996
MCYVKINVNDNKKGESLLFTHFQWQERKNNLINKEWSFSFLLQGAYYQGIYYKDGTIIWSGKQPPEEHLSSIETQVHDLILFHVFEDHTPPM